MNLQEATGDVQKAYPRGGGGAAQQGRRRFGARSVLIVREHDKEPTCLREAASAKAGNAAGLSAVALAKTDALFQHSH